MSPKRRVTQPKPSPTQPQFNIKQYVLGFPNHPTDPLDYRTILQNAIQRVRSILADRFLGISPTTISESDAKLLAGELELLVSPGQTIHLTTQPQVTFKPVTLVIDDEAAEWYDVFDIRIGKNSQCISVSRLPGSLFKASTSREISMDTAQVSMFITVSLTNMTTKPRRYPRISLYGDYI